MESLNFERTLTELDHLRLSNLIQRDKRGALPASLTQSVVELLDGADIVPSRQVSPDVVTMYSQILICDPAAGERSTVTVTYPADAEPGAGFVSVLSPLGRSVLGLPVGATASWVTPAGEERRAQILALLFQPEASGDYTT
jgi:regulator of nucleoside diphosphate kinase